MRRGFLFKTGRVAAIASLGSFAHALPGPAVERGRSVHEVEVLNFLDVFWSDAWNADFNLRESGMGLTPSRRSGSWSVTVYDPQGPIAEGSYDEVLRLLTPEAGVWAIDDDFAAVELFVTAGMLHGTDGFVTPTWGLARRITLAGDDKTAEQVVQGFTPLGTADDLAVAIASATYLFENLSRLAMPAGGEPFTTDPCWCQEIHDTDLAACAASTVGCDLRCTTIALGAIAACFAAGPFMPACIVLIIAAEIACLGACEASYRACALRAHSARLRCLQGCDGIRR